MQGVSYHIVSSLSDTNILNSQGDILYRLQVSQPVLHCSFCRKLNRFSFAVTKVNLTKFYGLQSEQDD